MRPRSIVPVLMIAAVLCFATATPAAAQYRRPGPPGGPGRYSRGFELNPYVTFNNFQQKAELDDEYGLGFRFGYLYDPTNEVEFLLNGVSTKDSFFGETVDLTNFQVAYVLNFTPKDVVPYVTAGLGFMHTDDADLGTETDPVLGLGAGIRFFLGRNFFARFEARENFFTGNGNVWGDGEHQRIQEVAFGVGWRYGLP